MLFVSIKRSISIMRSTSLPFLLVFSLLLLPHAFSRSAVLSSNSKPSSGPSNSAGMLDVKTICSKCTYPDRCLSTAKPEAGKPADATAILKLEMRALNLKVVAAKAEAESEAKDPKVRPRTKSYLLPRCISRFQDALKYLEMTSKALSRGEITTNAFGSISDKSRECREEFGMNLEAFPPPMEEHVKAITELAANCADIASNFMAATLKKKKHHGAGYKVSDAPSATPKPKTNMPAKTAAAATAAAPVAPSSGAVGVKAVCAKAKHPDRCISSVQAAAGAGAKLDSADAVTVLKYELKAIIDSASAASDKASALEKDPKTDAKAKGILPNCVRLYQVCMADIEHAKEAAAKNDLAQVKSILTAEIGLVDGCKKESDSAGVALPVQAQQEEVNELLLNSLYIVKSFWPSLKDLTESEAAYAGAKDMPSPGPEEAETEEEKKANDGKFVWDLPSIDNFGPKY